MKMKPGKVVTKGWGLFDAESAGSVGEIFAYHRPEEEKDFLVSVDTVKILYFEKNKKCSLHFHDKKNEIFICAQGRFNIEVVEKQAERLVYPLAMGERLFMPRLTPHRIIGLDDGPNILIEVSTQDRPEDSFRIERGD